MRLVQASFVLACLVAGTASAQPKPRLLLLELFTSQGCSSCPPADALLAKLATTRADVLPLTFHVTYWNGLGWHDPFSFDAATDRQRRYVALSVSPETHTPALVVDGARDVVGSDETAVRDAIALARSTMPPAIGIDVAASGQTLSITIGASEAGNRQDHADVLVIGYDHLHRTQVGRGENGGRTLLEANIVRSLQMAGSWRGQALHVSVHRQAGEEIAVLLQGDTGHILGVGRPGGDAR